jgi:hypothetical protein
LECSHENGKEQESATAEESASIILKVVENTADDESQSTLSE